MHPRSLRALHALMAGPHRRGGGRRSAEFKQAMSFRERFRRWALTYWPEAVR